MKTRIMLGVYLMYAVRKLKSPFVAEAFIFAMLALVLSVFISVPSVISNMLDSNSVYRYFLIAFSHTNFAVQITLVLSVLSGFYLVKNITLHTVFKQRLA